MLFESAPIQLIQEQAVFSMLLVAVFFSQMNHQMHIKKTMKPVKITLTIND